MYEIGDVIMYASTGVCEVVDIITLDEMRDVPKGQLHYKLKPLYENCEIFTPVENSKAYLRPVISAEEANGIIDSIPDIKIETFSGGSIQQLKDKYKAYLSTHSHRDLLTLTMSLYEKKQSKKFNQVDDTYMKRAEALLLGELAVALGIEKTEVSAYIADRLREKKNGGIFARESEKSAN